MKDFPNLISLNLSFCGFEFRAFEIYNIEEWLIIHNKIKKLEE